jgi:hypothetical protein
MKMTSNSIKFSNLSPQNAIVTRVVAIILVAATSMFGLIPIANAVNPPIVKLTVHYQRVAGDYTGWNLWLWRNVAVGTDSDVNTEGIPFTSSDDFGRIAKVDIDNMDRFENIGLIVRKGAWELKDIETDRFISQINSDGKVEIWLRQNDPVIYFEKPSGPAPKPASTQTASAEKPKVLTISCVKGKTTKKVTSENPKCPSGYKNPLDAFLTFQAFSKCKLFQKDQPSAGIVLLDGGRTLKFSSAGTYSSIWNNASSIEDVFCALSILKAPGFVEAQIETTRALDGLQKASWGKISAFWTYHPSKGLNITINTK